MSGESTGARARRAFNSSSRVSSSHRRATRARLPALSSIRVTISLMDRGRRNRCSPPRLSWILARQCPPSTSSKYNMRGSAYRVKKDGAIKRIAVVVRERNMKRLVLFASTLAILVAPLTVRAEQPPIIDRNLFFGEVEISGEKISPDGQFISFLKPYRGTRNIWVKKTGEPFSAARPVSAEVK